MLKLNRNLNNQNIMPKPIEELPPQSTEEHEKETQKPIVSKEEAMIENVISPKQKEPQNFDNNNVLPVPVQPSDNQNSNNKPINGLVYPNSQDAPTEQPKVQPQEQPQAIPQQQNMKPKFNPLKYIHPSLRQKYLKQQKQEELQKQNLPTESQTPEKENNNFGIKPTSPMTVSGNEFGDNGLKQKLNFDPIQTASVNNSKVLSVRIPFSTGTLVTAEGRKQIEILGNAIKTGGYKNIQLIGHADKGNNNSVDIQMSLKRALHIKNILKNYDDMLNFNTQSVGSNQPISGLSHYDDRNRRVDILLR